MSHQIMQLSAWLLLFVTSPLSAVTSDAILNHDLAAARGYRIRSNDPALWQEKLNRFAQLIVKHVEHPRVYEAELEIVKLLVGNSSPESLGKADLLLRDLLGRFQIRHPAGQEIAVAFLEFQLGVYSGVSRQDFALVDRVAEQLYELARQGEDHALRLLATAYRARSGFSQQVDVLAALRLAVDELDAAAAWANQAELEVMLRQDDQAYRSFIDAYGLLDAVAARILDGCRDPECIQVAKQLPNFFVERSSLDRSIAAWRPPPMDRQLVDLTPLSSGSRWRIVLIIANVVLIVVLLAFYLMKKYRTRGIRLLIFAVGCSSSLYIGSQGVIAYAEQGKEVLSNVTSIPLGKSSPSADSSAYAGKRSANLGGFSGDARPTFEAPKSADRSVSLTLKMTQRIIPIDLGYIDAIRPYVLDWELVNGAGRGMEIVELASDCNCVRIECDANGLIPPGGKIAGRFIYSNNILGSTTRKILLKSTIGEHQILLKSIASRGIYIEPPLELQANDSGFSVLVGAYQMSGVEKSKPFGVIDLEFDNKVLELSSQSIRQLEQRADYGEAVAYSVSEATFRFQPTQSAHIGSHYTPIVFHIGEKDSKTVLQKKTIQALIRVQRDFKIQPTALTTGFVDLRHDKLPIVLTARIQSPSRLRFSSARLDNKIPGVSFIAQQLEKSTVELRITISPGVVVNQPIGSTVTAEFLGASSDEGKAVQVPFKGFILDRAVATSSGF